MTAHCGHLHVTHPRNPWVDVSNAGVPRTPVYPVLLAIAFVLSAYASSNVMLEALWRPLAAAIVVTLVAQAVVGLLLQSADRGAYVVLILLFVLAGLPAIGLVLGGWLVAASAVAMWRGKGLRTMPWLRANRIANVASAIAVAAVTVSAA